MKAELTDHLGSPEGVANHLEILATAVMEVKEEIAVRSVAPGRRQVGVGAENTQLHVAIGHRMGDMVETDSAALTRKPLAAKGYDPTETDGFESKCPTVEADGGGAEVQDPAKLKVLAVVSPCADMERSGGSGSSDPNVYEVSVCKLRNEVQGMLKVELQKRHKVIGALQTAVAKMEKQLRTKTAEVEDRDFRLSLIENSSFDGTMVWKIPQFEQRMSDAKSGKYTSIFSLPFYTGRCGYKMCLRLYILGGGAGKSTHMSLFFVIMLNEFDSVLQWSFIRRVTFKLINQCGG